LHSCSRLKTTGEVSDVATGDVIVDVILAATNHRQRTTAEKLRTWTDSACDGIGDSIAREGSNFRRISPLITLLHFHAEWPKLIWRDRWGKACF